MTQNKSDICVKIVHSFYELTTQISENERELLMKTIGAILQLGAEWEYKHSDADNPLGLFSKVVQNNKQTIALKDMEENLIFVNTYGNA